MVNNDLLDKFSRVADELVKKEKDIAEADASIGFLWKSSLDQTRRTAKLLRNMKPVLQLIGTRKGICGKDGEIAFLQSYNMSAHCNYLIAQQLAVGNRVRMKPSEISVRAGQIFATIWKGIDPKNVAFDFSPGPEFMNWAIKEPDIKAIIMFGYHTVALSYMDAIKAAKKKFIFNGPGKNPYIVLEDADPEQSAHGLFLSRFRGMGQGCGSPGRMYIHAKIYDDFVERLIGKGKKLVIGDPRNPKTDIGPLGSALAVKRITNQLADAKAKGAQIVLGGKIEGNMVWPTIVTNCNHSMLGLKEESFGPICWLMPYNSVEEVISLAKDTELGHSLYVCGFKGLGKVLAELKGTDYVNEVNDFVFGRFGNMRINPDLSRRALNDMSFAYRPHGGYGYSGWVCEFNDGNFALKQGPKIEPIETSKGVKEN